MVVLLTRNKTQASCLLSLCAEDNTVRRDGLCSLPAAGTLGGTDAVRIFLWEVDICPGICTFVVNDEATYILVTSKRRLSC